MKFKLGHRYWTVDKGAIKETFFISVTIGIDSGFIFTIEEYLTADGARVEVCDRDRIVMSTPIFKSKKRAIDYQIRVLKGMKKNEN
jgi:hypothetical protein